MAAISWASTPSNKRYTAKGAFVAISEPGQSPAEYYKVSAASAIGFSFTGEQRADATALDDDPAREIVTRSSIQQVTLSFFVDPEDPGQALLRSLADASETDVTFLFYFPSMPETTSPAQTHTTHGREVVVTANPSEFAIQEVNQSNIFAASCLLTLTSDFAEALYDAHVSAS